MPSRLVGLPLLLALATLASSACVEPEKSSSDAQQVSSVPRSPPPESSGPRGVYPLAGLDPSLPDADLAAAFASIGTPEVLAFGETVHTSEGYAQARVRALRFLVEKQGVRALGFESNWRDAEVTRAFVERCEGTLEDARWGLTFRAWTSRATTQLLSWLCRYNEVHPDDRVTLFGFDVQDGAANASYVRAFFQKAAPADSAVAKALAPCVGAAFDSIGAAYQDPVEGAILRGEAQIPEERHTACHTSVDAAIALLEARRAPLSAATSPEELELALFSTRALAAFEDEMFYLASDPRRAYEARDRGMADGVMLMRTLRAPGKRTALVAHNEHIMRARDALVTTQDDWKSMGSWLGERIGAGYAPIGLFARSVSINWDGSTVTELPPRDGERDVERPLHALGQAPLFVDLADNEVFTPGAQYSLSELAMGTPVRHYRALVFLEISPPYEDP